MRNKFRSLVCSNGGCLTCRVQTNHLTVVDMAPEPVTLPVQIYSSTYNIVYLSEQRILDLISEFATMCKDERKPCGKEKFFVCIHCRKNSFSNKMMLNRHWCAPRLSTPTDRGHCSTHILTSSQRMRRWWRFLVGEPEHLQLHI